MPLIINDKSIEKISGPVSMYLIVPDLTVLNDSPMFMLFGDELNSSKNMCVEDKSEETYKIYDMEFLKLINKLGTDNEPVDFFLEGPIGETIKENGYPMEMLWNNYIKCNKKKCDNIENVNWKSSYPKNFLAKCTIYNLLLRLQRNYASQGEKIYDTFHRTLIDTTEKYIDDDCLSKLKNSDIDNHLIEFDQNIKFPTPVETKIFHEYFKNYWKYVLRTFFENKMYDIKKIETYHNNLTGFILKYSENKKINEENAKYLFENHNDIYSYILYEQAKQSVILDIYTILKSLKRYNSKDYNIPILNIFYLTNDHVKNIKYFLTKILSGYKPVYSFPSSSSTISRCINITDNINLSNITLPVV